MHDARFMMPLDLDLYSIPNHYLFARPVVPESSLALCPKTKLFDSHSHLDIIKRRLGLGTSSSLQEMVTRDSQVEVACILPVFT